MRKVYESILKNKSPGKALVVVSIGIWCLRSPEKLSSKSVWGILELGARACLYANMYMEQITLSFFAFIFFSFNFFPYTVK